MFCYLAKKIAIPNSTPLHAVGWDPSRGYIACGGAGGFLKVLRLDPVRHEDSRVRGIAAKTELTANQTLERHEGRVQRVAWNPNPRVEKLTTADDRGLIVVWTMHQNVWFIDMMNQRRDGVVAKDLKWNPAGREVAIVYEDGSVLVGSVDGTRLWGDTLPERLQRVQWSPDCRHLLLVTHDGNILRYTADGVRLGEVRLGAGGGGGNMAAIDWYSGKEGVMDEAAPRLVAAWANGRLTLLKDDADPSPVTLESGLRIVNATWNPQGTVLAVAGHEDGTPMVFFLDPYGRRLQKLKVPAKEIRGASWDGGGARLVIAADHFLFFANVRPKYTWTLLSPRPASSSAEASPASASTTSNVLVLSLPVPERQEKCVVFQDVLSGERRVKWVPRVAQVRGAGEHALLVCNGAQASSGSGEEAQASLRSGVTSGIAFGAAGTASAGMQMVILCDAIGTPLETKFIDLECVDSALTRTHVVVASRDSLWVWQFRTSAESHVYTAATSSTSDSTSDDADASASGPMSPTSARASVMARAAAELASAARVGRERTFHVDDSLSLDGTAGGGGEGSSTSGSAGRATMDGVVCVAACSTRLIVARESGKLQWYSLPHLVAEGAMRLSRPAKWMALNSNGERLVYSDQDSALSFVDLSRRSGAGDGSEVVGPDGVPMRRKDTWSALWAEDNPDLFATLEKARLHLFRWQRAGDGGVGAPEEEPAGDMDESSGGSGGGEGKEAEEEAGKKGKGKGKGKEKGSHPVTSGYLAHFSNLQVRVALLDELLAKPNAARVLSKEAAAGESAERREGERIGLVGGILAVYESAALRRVRETMEGSGGLSAAVSLVESSPHPRLWALIAEVALLALDFTVAERAFVECKQYRGVQFVKRLAVMGDRAKQRAEVHAYFGRIDEAEEVYRRVDRLDLAIELRARVGDWDRVLALAAEADAAAGGMDEDEKGGGKSSGTLDALMRESRERLGDWLADRQRWKEALAQFEAAQHVPGQVRCLLGLEDYDRLGSLAKSLPEHHEELSSIARHLRAAGAASAAAAAFLRAGDMKAAVDTCVLLNRWEEAVRLAKEHDFPQVESLLGQYAQRLLSTGRVIDAVALWREAGRPTEAARLLARLADEALRKLGGTGVPRAKRLYVLAALEVERARADAAAAAEAEASEESSSRKSKKKKKDRSARSSRSGGGSAAATLATLLAEDTTATARGDAGSGDRAARRTLDAAWHGAEACHLWLLAQRQLRAGELDAAVRSAARMPLYEDVLPHRAAHSLTAYVALRAGFLGLCSRAFIRLEADTDSVLGFGGSGGGGVGDVGVGGSGGGGGEMTIAAVGSTMVGSTLATVAAVGGGGARATATEASKAAARARREAHFRHQSRDLALAIFKESPPVDPSTRRYPCPSSGCEGRVLDHDPSCLECGTVFPVCILSGRPVRNEAAYRCSRCRSKILLAELADAAASAPRHCPLCHLPIDTSQIKARIDRERRMRAAKPEDSIAAGDDEAFLLM